MITQISQCWRMHDLRTSYFLAFYSIDQSLLLFKCITFKRSCYHNYDMTGKAPVIINHPQDVETLKGYKVILEVTANGDKPLYYQWHFEENEIPGM